MPCALLVWKLWMTFRSTSNEFLESVGVPDTVTSSPGDLDEAIRMAILVGDAGVNVDLVGSPFEKIESFRTGVLGGLDSCVAQLDG